MIRSMPFRAPLALPGVCLSAAFLLSSCSGVRPREGEPLPLLNALFAAVGTADSRPTARESSDDAGSRTPDEADITERLLAIAAHPHYRTAGRDASGGADEASAPAEEGEADPPRQPLPPIAIGDIFATGPESGALRPALRLPAPSPEDEPPRASTALPDDLIHVQSARIPITISQEELAQLREVAAPGRTLPTRSVALDFESRTHSLDPDRYRAWIAETTAAGRAGDEQAEAWRERWANVRASLRQGERMHLVVSITESEEIVASYPGAPAGSRDAELVGNAVATMFPQLEGIRAEAHEGKIRLTRTPGIYWSVEVRELGLDEEGRLAITGTEEPDFALETPSPGLPPSAAIGVPVP